MIAEALKSNKRLKHLELSYANCEERDARHIASMLLVNSTLQSLDLSGNALEDEGCDAICSAMKENSSVTSLSLISCSLSSESISGVAEMLLCNSMLQKLSIRFPSVETKDLQLLGEALAHNSTLSVLNFQSKAWEIDAKELFMRNTSLIDCPGTSKLLKEVCLRNRKMRLKARKAAMALLMIRARRHEKSMLHVLQKEIVALIARHVWNSKTEIDFWCK